MEARDLDGNEWTARKISSEEFDLMELRHGHEVFRNGSRQLILLDEGRSGIAFPKDYKSTVMYYGGLEYDRGEEEISVDGERCVAFVFQNLMDAHEERCDERGRWTDWEIHDTNVWYNYLQYLEDKWWNADGTPKEDC